MLIKEELLQFHAEIESVGILADSCSINGDVSGTDIDQMLVSLVLSAHNKAFLSPEVQALRNHLGGAEDPRWQAYVAERRKPIQSKRLARYQLLTDSMFLKAFELSEGARDVTINQVQYRLPLSSKIQAWQDAKQAIRDELKYPDEVA